MSNNSAEKSAPGRQLLSPTQWWLHLVVLLSLINHISSCAHTLTDLPVHAASAKATVCGMVKPGAVSTLRYTFVSTLSRRALFAHPMSRRAPPSTLVGALRRARRKTPRAPSTVRWAYLFEKHYFLGFPSPRKLNYWRVPGVRYRLLNQWEEYYGRPW
ncbi:hypothetical protein LLEC1_01692 [Akanthomyces lecanii]|uniref:Uncharacterized protein n=1 Tax=Cordyceps confragosa TaxID=2714763 RepID=A0A179I0W0_CORDF|nr:hypothetical protein LLEC1_01692 [Akanthomyces lecanii]